jgi:Gp157 protein
MAKMLNRYAPAIQQQISNLLLQYPELADDEILRADMIEGATDLQGFLTMLVGKAKDAQDLRDGSRKQLDDLKARRARLERQYEGLRALIRETLEIANLRKVVMPIATLSLSAGSPKLVGMLDATYLPDDLCKITREPDKEKIKQALLDGGTVPGVSLSNSEPVLSIHVK